MDKAVVIYTMQGCPYCDQIKRQLDENNIPFHERDIDVYEEEFDLFSELVGNEFVPAFMLIEYTEEGDPKSKLFSPEGDFDTIDEGDEIIKKFVL